MKKGEGAVLEIEKNVVSEEDVAGDENVGVVSEKDDEVLEDITESGNISEIEIEPEINSEPENKTETDIETASETKTEEESETVGENENEPEITCETTTEIELEIDGEPETAGEIEIEIEQETGDDTEKIHRKLNYKKIFIVIGAVAAILAAVYAAGVVYYSSHFFFNTKIGVIDCSNLTVEAAEKKINSDIENYTFTLSERGDEEEVVTGKEIHMKHTPVKNVKELKERQNAYEWLTNRSDRELPLDTEVTFNKDTLYNRITQLNCSARSRKIMEGRAGDIYYKDGRYHVDEKDSEDVISVNKVYQTAKKKVAALSGGMSLEDEECYVGANGDDKIKGVLNLINKYVGTEVTYKRGEEKTVLNGEEIKEWITVGENYSVKLNEDKISEYVKELVKSYDTVGKERKFKTSKGEEITVSGGNYGWLTDSEKETQQLCELIRKGETTSREPVYKKTAAAHGVKNDLAGTYVEISIGEQHLWYYKNGELIVSTDLVSGDPTKGNATPKGMYYVNYKERDTVLVGRDYRSPVTFWMPFNGGVGMHDASWRGSYGGRIYRGGGSHGCINLNYSAASKIYANISSGDPVVVY